MLSKIEAGSQRLNKILATYLSGSLLIAIVVLTIVDATRRTTLGAVFIGVRDVVQIMLAWVVFTAFAYALIREAHVRMLLVVNRLPASVRSGLEIFGGLVGVGLFILLTYLAVPYFWESWVIKEVPMSQVRSPVWLAKLALPVGSALILIELLLRFVRKLRPKREVIEEEKVTGI